MVAVWVGNLTMTTFQKHLSFGKNKDVVDSQFPQVRPRVLFQFYDV